MYPICLDRVSSTVVFSRAQATQFGRTDLASFCHVPKADCGAGVGANYPIQWYLAFQREVHWSSKCPVTRAQIVDNIPLLYKISKAVNTKFHLGFAVLPVSVVVVLGRFLVKEDKTELAFGVAFGSLILFIISLVLLIFHIQAVTAAYTLYEVRDRERETRGHIHARTHTHSLSRALSLSFSLSHTHNVEQLPANMRSQRFAALFNALYHCHCCRSSSQSSIAIVQPPSITIRVCMFCSYLQGCL